MNLLFLTGQRWTHNEEGESQNICRIKEKATQRRGTNQQDEGESKTTYIKLNKEFEIRKGE